MHRAWRRPGAEPPRPGTDRGRGAPGSRRARTNRSLGPAQPQPSKPTSGPPSAPRARSAEMAVAERPEIAGRAQGADPEEGLGVAQPERLELADRGLELLVDLRGVELVVVARGVASGAPRPSSAAAASKSLRSPSSRSRRTVRPIAWSCPPKRSRRSAQGRRKSCRERPGTLRPEPVARSPSTASSSTGRWSSRASRPAAMPTMPRCQPSRQATTIGGSSPSRRDLGSGLLENRRLESAGAGDCARRAARPARAARRAIAGEQDLERRLRRIEPSGGVQPRSDAEADVHRAHRRLDARRLEQRAQSRRARAGERRQPEGGDHPVLADERRDVGDGAEAGDAQQRGPGHRAPAALQMRRRQLERQSGAGQVAEGIAHSRAGGG